ncbi:PD-(D/E)XK nuclease family protein [Xylanibacillus composti]|uniref:Death domain-containing protein n=1 Tax=Xylanibacillus composti TaxID=1572762 RepID=A0A8J4M1L6_9BACL|nr:PD-(D/E)XK nuclease family protein [Xylanibacillus composti]GIQ68985.1 hypothetical protein XYCOK13_18090 [Xylanibacillus composti]
MAFVVRPFPEWSWSQSRDQLFRECPRKYYYHYYASHNGWQREASEEAQAAYRLKQLANLYLVMGDELHQIAEHLLQRWEEQAGDAAADELVERLRRRLNQAFLDSRDVPRWKRAPKKSTMLHEMYYIGELPQDRVEKIKRRLRVCVDGLLRSLTWRELTASPSMRIAEVEQLRTFEVEGTPVYVKMDALLEDRSRERPWIMVDWKTGMEDEKNEEQLILYAIYLGEQAGIPPEQLELRVEYLLTGETKTVYADQADMERVREAMSRSMAAMKACLADPERNAPKPKEAFASRPSRAVCAGCNFRELCEEKA